MKRNQSQSNKVRIELSDFFFDRKPIIKNSSYYTKLYSPNQRDLKENSSMNTIFPNKTYHTLISPKHKLLSLKKVFNNPMNSRNIKIKWPKITHAKWPFSKKRTESEEMKKQRILSSKPSHKYHDFNTIKWLSQKYSDSVKEKSIYSLLPNNGKPLVPEYESEFNKRHREMLEYLESFRGPGGREKFVNINPKYFYDSTTFKKILKLREMFLEFDKKGNHKMIIKEIVELFKQNNIKVDINELKNLFLRNIKNIKKKNEPVNLLYLDFYQFMNFALSHDQDFRKFMRIVKKKNKIEEKNKISNTISYKEKKDNIYIPMNFNLIFNYFINKEKQRNSVRVVENAINEMDQIIQGLSEIENKKIENKINKNKNINKKNYYTSKTLKDQNVKLLNIKSYHRGNTISEEKEINRESSEKNLKKTKNIITKITEMIEKEKEEKLKSINFAQLIKEFSTLFEIKENNNVENESIDDKNRIKSANITKSNIINHYNNYHFNKDTSKSNEDNTYEGTVKKEIRINSLKEMGVNNFEKYHDLKLALKETKQQIKNLKSYSNNLIEEDIKTYNMVDIRDLVEQDNSKSQNLKMKNFFSKPKILKNNNNPFVKNDIDYLINRTDYSKNLKIENNFTKKKKYILNKKHIYNYYCGKPTIVNIEDNNCVKNYKYKSKKDYVPNEFFTNIKEKRHDK